MGAERPALTDRLSVYDPATMPRTLDPALHSTRREAFLDAAQRLIQAQGYEAMSVQDVLDAVDTSRGAFYHYFDSKQALLEGVVERFADAALAGLEPVLDDTSLSAARKLERIFGGIQSFKAERRELVLAIVEVWNSDANAIVREKLRRLSTRRLVPVLAPVIEAGVAEGAWRAPGPAEETAGLLLALLLGFQERALELFLGRHSGTVTFAEVERSIGAFTRGFERILGAPAGSLVLVDKRALEMWFG